MDNQAALPSHDIDDASASDSPESLKAQLTMIERTASAAHAAIDKFANKADATLRKVRSMASRASERFERGCQSYSGWEDECVEEARERIRARPLTALAIGLAIGCLLGRLTRS